MWLNDLINNKATYHSLRCQVSALLPSLKPAQTIALYTQDAQKFLIALLAAWQAGAEIWLLPNLTQEAQVWAAQADLCLSDQVISHHNGIILDNIPSAHAPIHLNLSSQARLILQTSGSSGQAKLIQKTAQQMCDEAQTIAQTLPSNWRQCRALASISPQHLYGLTFRIFVALQMDWSIESETCAFPEDFICQSKQNCIWLSSPTLLSHCVLSHSQNWQKNVLGIISAGGMLPEPTRQIFAQYITDITDIYGSSETGVMAWRRNQNKHHLFKHVQLTLQQDNWSVQSLWSGGEHQLADNIEHEHNTLVIHGRVDRIIKLGDKRLSLHQIENTLIHHPYIADAHCVFYQRRIGAWLALNEAGINYFRQQGRKATIENIRQSLQPQLERIALPRYWRFIAHHLPRNMQGKLRAQDVSQVFETTCRTPIWHQDAQNGQEYEFSAVVPLELCYFPGHFATFPLVPGVIEVQWVVDLAKQVGLLSKPIYQIENLKYQNFIRPNDTVRVQLRYDEVKAKIYFSLSVLDHSCAVGRIIIAK